MHPWVVLIVNAAVITDCSLLIQQEYFELPRGPEAVDGLMPDILHDRKFETELLPEQGNISQCILIVGINAHDRYVWMTADLVESRRVQAGQRALRANKRYHDQLASQLAEIDGKIGRTGQ